MLPFCALQPQVVTTMLHLTMHDVPRSVIALIRLSTKYQPFLVNTVIVTLSAQRRVLKALQFIQRLSAGLL